MYCTYRQIDGTGLYYIIVGTYCIKIKNIIIDNQKKVF